MICIENIASYIPTGYDSNYEKKESFTVLSAQDVVICKHTNEFFFTENTILYAIDIKE